LTKSDPGYFSQVIRYIGEPPENIVMVGDSYTRDIVPALAQGLRGVWLNAGCSIHESKVPVIRSLNELSGLVDSINAID
jgi:putative hydrolase of the HAD superfamily